MRWWVVVILGIVLVSGRVAQAADCNGNAVADADEIASGAVADCDANGVPDPCDLFPIAFARTTVSVPPGQPVGLVATDLDADRDVDVAVTHGASALVSVLVGAGDGTFTAGDTTTVGTGPTAIAAGELPDIIVIDGSGTDLFVANAGSNSVMRLANAGDATFTADPGIAVGTFPIDLALGSLTSGLGVNIVVVNRTDDTITVLAYTGFATFTPTTPVATAAGPQAVVVADFTRDGRDDALVASRTADQLTLHRNDGLGVLLAAESVAAVNDPIALAAGDFTGDGEIDAVVASFDGATLTLFQGDALGALTGAGAITLPGKPTDVALVDLDGDGYRDLVATLATTNQVAVALNTRAGGFGTPTYLDTGESPVTVVATDVDSDGRPDLIVANAFDGTLMVYRQQTTAAAVDCNGTSVPDQCELGTADCNTNAVPDACDLEAGFRFAPPATTPLDTRVDALAAGDFDGDGDADVAYLADGADQLRLLRRADDGTLGPWTSVDFAVVPRTLAAADLEPDGDVDVAVSLADDSIAVLRNLGDGTFDPPTFHPAGLLAAFLLALDMDGMGGLDLVAGSQSLPGGVFAVLRSTGSGFAAPTSIAIANTPLSLAPIDFDLDGDTDLMTATFGAVSVLRVLLNDGSGTLSLGASAPAPVLGLWLAAVAGDVGQGPATDIVTTSLTPSRDLGVGIFAGDGTGGYPALTQRFPVPLRTGSGFLGFGFIFSAPTQLVVVDLDGDGDLDLLATDSSRPSLKAYARSGVALSEIADVPLPEAPSFVSVGDVDRDGIADLVVAGRSQQLHTVRSMARPVSHDCLGSGIPDECEFVETDCNTNRVPDTCELPATDANGDGLPDCAERAANCANCVDDDGDGVRDLADDQCPSTALTIVRAKASRGTRRKGGRLRITAEVPTLLDALASAAPALAVELAGDVLYCGPISVKGKRNRFRLAGATAPLKAFVATLRKKKGQTRLVLTLQDPAIVPSAAAQVRVSLQGGVGPYTGAGTTP